MAYLDDKGYCSNCKKVTAHRFSLLIRCNNCGKVSTQREYLESVKEQKENSDE